MAGNSGAIRAGKAVVEIWADKSPLQKGLNDAKKSLSSWGKSVGVVGASIAAAGAAIRAPIIAATAAFSEAGSSVYDLSAKTGLSAESIGRLGYAAEQAGAGIEDVEGGVKKMQKFLSDAAHGSAEATTELRRLGLTSTQLKNLKPEDQFATIARAIAKIPSATERTAAALKIFGKGGTSLLPMIQEFDALDAKARSLGIGISTEDAAAADALGDSFSDVFAVTKSLTFAVGGALAKSFTDFNNYVVQGVKFVRDWVQQNQGIVVIGATIGTVLLTVGTAIVGIGSALYLASIAAGGLSAALGAVTAAATVAYGALASPWVLIGAAIVAASAALLYFTGGGTAAINTIKESVGTLAGDFTSAFGAVSNALAAGDIAAAVGVLWATVKLEWQRGVSALTGIWEGFKANALIIIGDMMTGATRVVLDGWISIQETFATFGDAIMSGWRYLWAGAGMVFNEVVAYISKKLNDLMLLFENSFTYLNPSQYVSSDAAKLYEETRSQNRQKRQEIDAGIEQRRQAASTAITSGLNEANAKQEAAGQTRQAGYDQKRAELSQWSKDMTQAFRMVVNSSRDDATKEAEAALAKSREDLKLATDKANSAKASNLASIVPTPGQNVPTLEQQSLKMSAGGTFSAFGGQGVAGNAMDRTAKATEETAKNTKEIKKKTKPADVASLR